MDDVITEEDLVEAQFPWAEISEMDAIEDGLHCCRSLPCRNPEECPR